MQEKIANLMTAISISKPQQEKYEDHSKRKKEIYGETTSISEEQKKRTKLNIKTSQLVHNK